MQVNEKTLFDKSKESKEEVRTKLFGEGWEPYDVKKVKEKLLSGEEDTVLIIDPLDWSYVIHTRRTRLVNGKPLMLDSKDTPKASKKLHQFPNRTRIDMEVNTDWLSPEEVIERLKVFADRGFSPILDKGQGAEFMNHFFRFIKIHKAERGFLFCDMFDQSYPNVTLDKMLVFNDELEAVEKAKQYEESQIKKDESVDKKAKQKKEVQKQEKEVREEKSS